MFVGLWLHDCEFDLTELQGAVRPWRKYAFYRVFRLQVIAPRFWPGEVRSGRVTGLSLWPSSNSGTASVMRSDPLWQTAVSSSLWNQFCIQTVVAVPSAAVERTRLYRQCRRRDKSGAGAVATGRCRRCGSDVDRVDGGRRHPRRTDADTRDTAVLVSVARCRQPLVSSETETRSLPSSLSAATSRR